MKLFTQNIDCLEREAGTPGEKIVEAHGSFASQRCIECKKTYPDDMMKTAIKEKDVPRCVDKRCNGLVKPDIVFFGEALPEAFHMNRGLPAAADLAVVMGTSLTVQPFASLPTFVSEGTPRVLINLERVGGLGSRPDDVLLLGDCDGGVRRFADALGWRDELEALWEETNPEKGKKKADEPPKTRDEKVKDEVEKLTEDIDRTLKLSEEHQRAVNTSLGKGDAVGANIREGAQDNDGAERAGEAETSDGGKDGVGTEQADVNAEQVKDAAVEKDQSVNGVNSGDWSLGHVYPHLKKSSL